MSDKVLMENMLLLLKSTTEVFVHGSLESSTKAVHNVIKNGLDDIIKLQDDLYNKMTECGWYKVQNVESKCIKQTLRKLESNN
ncbi:MAG: spore coat protein [Bacilli bacterium]|jgi:spore coat protein CotF|nr:spore coat protein [Bacilli bacterium]MCX4253872.1 spore coat protein [Bacilli bacterium]